MMDRSEAVADTDTSVEAAASFFECNGLLAMPAGDFCWISDNLVNFSLSIFRLVNFCNKV